MGTLIRKTDDSYYSRFYTNSLPIRGGIDSAIAYHLPSPDRMTFEDVQGQHSAKSVRDMVTVWGEEFGWWNFLTQPNNPFSGPKHTQTTEKKRSAPTTHQQTDEMA